MFHPTQAEEQFECTSCFSVYVNAFHGNKELSLVMNLQGNGIILSHSENKFLNTATCRVEGIQRGNGENRRGVAYVRCIDSEGDIVIYQCTRTGNDAGFLEGTGKYKGSKGSFKTEPIARDNQRCRVPCKFAIR